MLTKAIVNYNAPVRKYKSHHL
jgi:hypothetical protein